MGAISWAKNLSGKQWLALEAIRLYLGVGLFVRGALFVSEPELVHGVLETSGGDWLLPFAIAHLVAMAHLGGGLMLALGLFTRLAAAVQILPVFGAVFFVHLHEGLFSTGQSLELSVLVLFLLGIFSIFGGGKLSVDAHLHTASDETTGKLQERHAH